MSRTVRIEKRKRGFFGKLMKLAFILFNLFMVYAVFSGIVSVSQDAPSRMSDIEKAGYGAGTALGFGFLIFVWAAGDIILGLFVLLTRGSKIITEEVVS